MGKEIRQQLLDRIMALCEEHGCSDKIKKLHSAQYVDQRWNPHPPIEFRKWWKTQPDYAQGIDAVRAFNCQCYRDAWSEAKTHGVDTRSSG